MKKSIFMLAVLAGTVFTSCKDNQEKQEDAVENVSEASEDLNEVNSEIKSDATEKANEQEWNSYKAEVEKTIAANDARIDELQAAVKKSGDKIEAAYKQSIAELDEKNDALKKRLNDYEGNQTNWNEFKREFNSDMEGIGSSLKNLTENNKK